MVEILTAAGYEVQTADDGCMDLRVFRAAAGNRSYRYPDAGVRWLRDDPLYSGDQPKRKDNVHQRGNQPIPGSSHKERKRIWCTGVNQAIFQKRLASLNERLAERTAARIRSSGKNRRSGVIDAQKARLDTGSKSQRSCSGRLQRSCRKILQIISVESGST